MSTGKFFAVSADRFAEACELGIGQAVSYLVLACGTGRDHVTTAWSCRAITAYAGINPVRARRFVNELAEDGLLAIHGSTAKPRYTLTAGDNPIWLPNSIVTADPSPVWRIRQTRKVDILQAFLHLYNHQNLGIDGGIHPELLLARYEAEEIGKVGACRIFGVSGTRRKQTKSWHYAQNGPLRRFSCWEDINTLIDLGLVVKAVHVFDGPIIEEDAQADEVEGDFVYSLDGPTEEESLDEYFRNYLSGFEQDWLTAISEDKSHESDYLALVPKHIEDPHFAGIYRMRHTANTKAHSQWWARIMKGRRDMARILGDG